MQQYDSKLKLVSDGKYKVDKKSIEKWKFQALDKFMKECGSALNYTATVSQYFTIPELFALKEFMYKHDTRRMLQMAHQRYEQTGLKQWKHSEKWAHYCDNCTSKKSLETQFNMRVEHG